MFLLFSQRSGIVLEDLGFSCFSAFMFSFVGGCDGSEVGVQVCNPKATCSRPGCDREDIQPETIALPLDQVCLLWWPLKRGTPERALCSLLFVQSP